MRTAAPLADSGAFDAGQALCRQGHVRVALSYLRLGVEEAPHDSGRRAFFARAALQVGEAGVVVEQADRMLAEDPLDVRALLLRALGLVVAGAAIDAVVPARRALELAPTDPEVFAVLALCLRRSGDVEEAVAAQRRCDELGGPAHGPRSLIRLLGLPVEPSGSDFWSQNEAGLKCMQERRFGPAMRAFAAAAVDRPGSGVPVHYMHQCMLAYLDDVGRWISRWPPLAPFVLLVAAMRILLFRRSTPKGFWRGIVHDGVRSLDRRSVQQAAMGAGAVGTAGVLGLAVDVPDSLGYLIWVAVVAVAVASLSFLGRVA